MLLCIFQTTFAKSPYTHHALTLFLQFYLGLYNKELASMGKKHLEFSLPIKKKFCKFGVSIETQTFHPISTSCKSTKLFTLALPRFCILWHVFKFWLALL